MLPVEYHHVVFTLPAEVAELALANPAALLNAAPLSTAPLSTAPLYVGSMTPAPREEGRP